MGRAGTVRRGTSLRPILRHLSEQLRHARYRVYVEQRLAVGARRQRALPRLAALLLRLCWLLLLLLLVGLLLLLVGCQCKLVQRVRGAAVLPV